VPFLRGEAENNWLRFRAPGGGEEMRKDGWMKRKREALAATGDGVGDGEVGRGECVHLPYVCLKRFLGLLQIHVPDW